MEENKDKFYAKADKGKLEISLVPPQIMRDCALIRMYGVHKYHSRNSWCIIEKQRYIDAMMRHLLAFLDDENSIDEESGLPHYMHAACNMAFICEMMQPNWEEKKQSLITHDPILIDELNKEEAVKSKEILDEIDKNKKHHSRKGGDCV